MLALFTIMSNICLMIMKTKRLEQHLFNKDTSQFTDLKCHTQNSDHYVFVIMLNRVIKCEKVISSPEMPCIYLIFKRVFQCIKLANHFHQRRWSPRKRCYLCVSINSWNIVLFKKERNG